MKLSEAIRLGAMLKPQGFGSRASSLREPNTVCAIEAAALALGIETGEELLFEEPSYYAEIQGRYPFIARACPECGCLNSSPGRVIWHLNDYHRWTRERIADWVETIEREQANGQADPIERPSLAEA